MRSWVSWRIAGKWFLLTNLDVPEPHVAVKMLPISTAAKGVLWTVLFGMAKTCQYGGLTILGVEGYQRLKDWLKRKKRQPRP